MKHKLNRIFCAVVTVLLCVGILTSVVPAVSAVSGPAGEELSWTLENGTLTVSGTGAIPDYTSRVPAPWSEHGDMIQRVVITDGVTRVGKMAFYCCPNLTMVILPESVKALGEQAFAGCRNLAQINLQFVEAIERGCFYECMSLVNVTLGDKLHTIGDKAFYHCTNLGGITLPASVTSFGNSVFTYCTSLVYVRIAAKLEVLPYWSFYGCSALWEVYLPDELEVVEDNALSECHSLYFVDYGGSPAVKDDIQKQLDEKNLLMGTSIPSVEYEKTEGAEITTVTKVDPDSGKLNTTIHATVTDSSGWNEVVESVRTEIRHGNDPQVDIYVQEEIQILEGAFNDLLENKVILNIHTSENVDWQVIMGDQTETTTNGSQQFTMALEKNEQNAYEKQIGIADSYTITLGSTTLNSTALFPLGPDTARKVATLYAVDGDELRKLSSVIVDDDGRAAFNVAGTESGKYVLALDVKDITREETRIPQNLASEYDITYGSTLMDAYGNQYVLTGRVNKMGFGIGTLTLIVVGILIGTGVLVGIIMGIWNKQKRKQDTSYRTSRR